MTYSPIIVFNPEGLTEDQTKRIKDALDAAYRAGYETAKDFYKLKINESNTVTAPNIGLQGIGYPNQPGSWGVINCGAGPLINGTMSY
jgi:hypothetical protein